MTEKMAAEEEREKLEALATELTNKRRELNFQSEELARKWETVERFQSVMNQ